MFTVVENMANDVPLVAAFMAKHILSILPDGQKITVRMSTAAPLVKQYVVFANAVITKPNAQGAWIKPHLAATDD